MLVKTVRFEALAKTFRLKNGKPLTTHRYACVGPGDDVIVRGHDSVGVRCKNGEAQISPTYSARDSLSIGPRELVVRVKEITTEDELHSYHRLEDFHYRGKALHGRRVPLIVCSSDPLLPRVLGYVELATAFMMSRPRAALFDGEFNDGNVRWTRWDKDAAGRYTNVVVRIARTVVSPEFRGLGIASILVRHAAKYAQCHWQVGGLKSLFLEITADMLRYVPFVESAGMHYIGDTEGNLARVNKDMRYVLNNYSRVKKKEILREDSAGIVDLQVHYATKLQEVEKEHGVPRDKLLDMLLKSPHHLSDENWTLLHRILRLPKPSFLMGLSSPARSFIAERVAALRLPLTYPAARPESSPPRLASPVEVRECSLSMSSRSIRTPATRKIQQAFGVSRDMLTTTLFADLSFKIQPGDIVLICGPSGAGKTTLLNLLGQQLRKPASLKPGLQGQIVVPPRVSVSTLREIANGRPLIDALETSRFEDALFALNVSGLAEPHLYVKRFHELSNGQRYRAMVARLIASPSDVWIADEFCATLDAITANIVSRNLRRCAKHLGVTVVLAAANWSSFVEELRPDVVVQLRAPWDWTVFRWPEFQAAAKKSRALGNAPPRDVSTSRQPSRGTRGRSNDC